MNTTLTLLYKTITDLYRGRNLIWQIIGIIAVLILVISGMDWWYFTHLRNTVFYRFFIYAGLVGFFVPGLLVLFLWIVGKLRNSARMITAGFVTLYAGILGWCVSSLYKFFTGRIHPYHTHDALIPNLGNLPDTSGIWNFGFGQGGIFWGWPSSHTTVAFSMMVALALYYRDKRWIGVFAILYAFYIAIGASIGFHWLSDAVFAIILGSIIGISVVKNYPTG